MVSDTATIWKDEATMGKTTLILASILAATTSIAADWFVAKDGDDANSGASRAEAKATIPAACACLSSPGDRLVIGDGDWSISEPIVLTNGWCATGEHGRGATTLIPSLATNIFVLGSADSSVSGLTIDFNPIGNYNTIASGLVAINPVGSISDCLVKNYKSTWGNSLIRMDDAASHLVVDRCDFENCYITYWTAVFWLENGTADFSNCTFTTCRGCNNSYEYFNYGMVYATKASTFRNCLFLRCKTAGRNGSADSNIITAANNAKAVIESCSFVDCAVLNGSNGGAVGCLNLSSGNGGTAYNCLAYNCVNDFGPAGLMGGITYSHCAQETALAGEGNVVVNDANSTFRNIHDGRSIPLTGPALDGGMRRDWMTGATDIAGTARVVGEAPDIGCYENSGVEPTPATYYVAKDGDDANPGTSRALAKATIAAGCALLSDYDERLVIGDGEWSISEPIVLTKGWSVSGEHGRGATTLIPSLATNIFVLSSFGASISGLTIDFNNINYDRIASGLVAINPAGSISDCLVKNYKSTWGNSLIRMDDAASHLVVDRCDFENCYITYWTAVFWLENGTADFSNCTFTTCRGCNNSYEYFNYGMVYATKASTFRNCLFLRCKTAGRNGSADSNIITAANNAKAVIESCSFVDCAVLNGSNGGAVGCLNLSSGNGGTAYNCLAYNCVNDFGPAGLMSGVTYSHCAQETALAGEGNVVVNAANSTFRNIRDGRSIPLTGPALDGGTRRDWMTGAKDIAGTDRVVGDAPDIGCYENSGVEREPATYYVAKDGDDANPGTSRALAKATIAAGCALLSDYDERLVICDGEWSISEPIVLTKGWSVSGEHGRGATTLIPSLATNIFVLSSFGASISGLTIDFNNINYDRIASGLVAINPAGSISDCLVKNYKSTWGNSLIRMDDAASYLVVDRCDFDNCFVTYGSAVFYLWNCTADFSNCTFTNCRGCSNSYGYFNYGMIYATRASTFRNCLFLRCKAALRSGTSDSNIITVANGAKAVIESCSFIDCAVLNGSNGGAVGGQILSSGPGGNVYNCLAYNCTNVTGTAGFMSGMTYSHCAAESLPDGDGNVLLTDSNFRFVDIANDDYRVKRGPSINAGLNLDWMVGATDLAGNPRIMDHIVDIGCYESDRPKPTQIFVR